MVDHPSEFELEQRVGWLEGKVDSRWITVESYISQLERKIKDLERKIETLESKLDDTNDLAKNANRWSHSH